MHNIFCTSGSTCIWEGSSLVPYHVFTSAFILRGYKVGVLHVKLFLRVCRSYVCVLSFRVWTLVFWKEIPRRLFLVEFISIRPIYSLFRNTCQVSILGGVQASRAATWINKIQPRSRYVVSWMYICRAPSWQAHSTWQTWGDSAVCILHSDAPSFPRFDWLSSTVLLVMVQVCDLFRYDVGCGRMSSWLKYGTYVALRMKETGLVWLDYNCIISWNQIDTRFDGWRMSSNSMVSYSLNWHDHLHPVDIMTILCIMNEFEDHSLNYVDSNFLQEVQDHSLINSQFGCSSFDRHALDLLERMLTLDPKQVHPCSW